MVQFLDCIFRLAELNKLSIEADTYLLEGLTKCSMEDYSKPFDMMLQ